MWGLIMESFIRRQSAHKIRFIAISIMMLLLSITYVSKASADAIKNDHLITVYDRGVKRVLLTRSNTVKSALRDAGVTLENRDRVEPAANTELVARNYSINIYRATPVTVIDGQTRQKIMTSAQTPERMIKDSTVQPLNDEDRVTVAPSQDITTDGAGTILTIHRATPVTLKLYGKPLTTATHGKTVAEALQNKGIKLTSDDTVTPDTSTPVTAGMEISVWREGVQTTTIEEVVPFTVRQVLDFDHAVGYKSIQAKGVNGISDVTYQFTARSGQEVDRKIIQTVVIKKPVEQIELVGAGPSTMALSQSKGAQYFTDSQGVSHRETYYDLPMSIVMNACGGGDYTVRADGAKVDKDGYILVAAHLGNYPRCSVVETSMGLGKVYDTGGFVKNHPHGFDLATDWSNRNGR